MILDIPGHNPKKVAEYFCYRISNENFRDIRFSFDHMEGVPRVILKGSAEEVLRLVNGFVQEHDLADR